MKHDMDDDGTTFVSITCFHTVHSYVKIKRKLIDIQPLY